MGMLKKIERPKGRLLQTLTLISTIVEGKLFRGRKVRGLEAVEGEISITSTRSMLENIALLRGGVPKARLRLATIYFIPLCHHLIIANHSIRPYAATIESKLSDFCRLPFCE